MKRIKDHWIQSWLIQAFQYQLLHPNPLQEKSSTIRTYSFFSYTCYAVFFFWGTLLARCNFPIHFSCKSSLMMIKPVLVNFHRSARSLAGSGTPPFRTYMRAAKSGPSTMALYSDSSSEDESAPVTSKTSVTQPRPIPRSVSLNNYQTLITIYLTKIVLIKVWNMCNINPPLNSASYFVTSR